MNNTAFSQNDSNRPSPKPHSIVFVDDERNILNSLRRLFRSERYKVYTALSGKEALEIIQKENISLVISDYRMPEMTGGELMKHVKEISPVTIRIILTGYTDITTAIDAINKGEVYRFITKPWNDQNLKILIKQALEHYDVLAENRFLLELIQRKNFELQEINEKLEQRVEEKTKELIEAELKYRTLVERADDFIFTLNHEGKFLFANRKVEDLGYQPGELIGKNFGEILPEDWDKSRILSMLFRERKNSLEINFREKGSGEILNMLLTTSVLEEKEGAVTTILGIARDLTREKDLKEQLLRADRLASLGRLVAGVSHEVLNPANIISLRLQLLQGRKDLPDEVKKDFEIISTQLSRMVKIAEGLLSFSRTSPQKKGSVDINKALAKTIALVEEGFLLDNIKVVKSLSPNLPRVVAEEDQLAQIFLNLFNNARQAMPGGGTLSVRTRPFEKTAENETGENKKLVEIEISDTGHGISEEMREHIFDPFFSTKPQGQGTGLGLSISYGIIKSFNGDIYVKKKKGHGACFFIQLETEKS